MLTPRLVDAIIRQTTVLIAQLTVTAGIRSPLAHLADEVFLSLSRELEEQGVSRKVVADMFGLALRSYQRRVQRLNESQTESGRTLWQSVFDYLQREGAATRRAVFDRFVRDDPEAVGAVLNDLVQSGLVSRTGSGGATVFAPTPAETWRLMARQGREETAAALVWLDVCRHPDSTPEQSSARLGLDDEVVARICGRLVEEGRCVASASGELRASEAMVIPVGAEQGWEAAVFDHFQAVVAALVAKLRLSAASQASDTTGGTTLSFEVCAEHPLRTEVLGLLSKYRLETDRLWERVEAENERRPISEEEMERVVFYFGQFVKSGENQP